MTMISDKIRIPGTTYYVVLKDKSLILSLRGRIVERGRVSESETEIYKTLGRLLTKNQVYIAKPTLKEIAKKLLSSYRIVVEEKKPEETVTARELALRSKMRRTAKKAVVVNGPKELIKTELSKLLQNEETITQLLSSYENAYAELNVNLPNDEKLSIIFTNWNKLLEVVDTAKIILLLDIDDIGSKTTELFDAIKGFREKTNSPFVLIVHRDESKERVTSLEELRQMCDSSNTVYYENIHITDIFNDLKRLLDATEEQITEVVNDLNDRYLGKLIEEQRLEEEKRKAEEAAALEEAAKEEQQLSEKEVEVKEEKKKKKGFLSKLFGKGD